MSNPYATERWLRKRVAELERALRQVCALHTDQSAEGGEDRLPGDWRLPAEVNEALELLEKGK